MTDVQKTDAEIQYEMWLKSERNDCKRIALEYASKLPYSKPDGLLEESKKIYDWLIEDLK